MNVAITKKQLGLNCWSAERFCVGSCKRLEECKYPEKKTCKAHLRKSIDKFVFGGGAEPDYQI